LNNAAVGKGFFFAILSYCMWGIFPLYWKLLAAVDPLHILAFRILLSLVLVSAILLAHKNVAWLVIFREPRKAGFLVLTALIITCNWGLYIWAVNLGHTLEASLGYYINPLISIMLGLLFFRERLRPLQWAAVVIALIGVLILTVLSGRLPWISLALALTFGFYGLLKKKLSLSALESLGAETLISAPVGLMLLGCRLGSAPDTSASLWQGWQGLAYLSVLPVHTWAILALAGLITMLPLYCFALSAKLLPLSTLGFTQFISPTIQFVLGLFVFGESFPPHHFAAFAFIWIAVILYIVSLKRV
jgi:chloramphenicol-sensitive protein RarD